MSESVDISKIEDRAKLSESILIDIDDWCEEEYSGGPRNHLGGSQIGKPCSRELYYAFRHVKKPDFSSAKRSSGQVLRLFQRGHREEIPFTEYLKGIGCKLEATPETQIRISDVGGHFGGSLDNVGYLPERYGIADRVLFEFKTMNMSYFNRIVKHGLIKTFPVYWSQMCVYGFKAELKYGFFMSVDKNTDALYIEIVELDWEHGKTMIDKAAMIITTNQPPAKISMHDTNFACKWCDFKNVCHHGEAVDKNCRSCKHSVPVDEGKWVCGLVSQVIPEDVIPVGCPQFEGIQ